MPNLFLNPTCGCGRHETWMMWRSETEIWKWGAHWSRRSGWILCHHNDSEMLCATCKHWSVLCSCKLFLSKFLDCDVNAESCKLEQLILLCRMLLIWTVASLSLTQTISYMLSNIHVVRVIQLHMFKIHNSRDVWVRWWSFNHIKACGNIVADGCQNVTSLISFHLTRLKHMHITNSSYFILLHWTSKHPIKHFQKSYNIDSFMFIAGDRHQLLRNPEWKSG